MQWHPFAEDVTYAPLVEKVDNLHILHINIPEGTTLVCDVWRGSTQCIRCRPYTINK